MQVGFCVTAISAINRDVEDVPVSTRIKKKSEKINPYHSRKMSRFSYIKVHIIAQSHTCTTRHVVTFPTGSVLISDCGMASFFIILFDSGRYGIASIYENESL